MSRRAWTSGLVMTAALLSIASAGRTAPQPVPVMPYYLAQGDPRACPSPMCGGLFVHLVNRSRTTCGDGRGQPACYVASVDLGGLGVSNAKQSRLADLVSAGRALVRGRLVRGRIQDFPELDTLVASEVWPASGSSRAPAGVFRRLRDNGVRCIAAPCFSTDALTLNPARPGARVTVSQVDLRGTGAMQAAQQRALRLIAHGDLIAAGRILVVPKAGPAGKGRTFVASQLYTRTA